MLAAVILRAALPVLVNVTFWVALPPTLTLLKATVEGPIVICACVVVPEPLRLIVSGEPGALLVIETLPLEDPATVGAYVTVNEVVWPGFRLAGAAHSVRVNPVPVMLWAVIETGAVPLFDRVTGTEPLAPTTTPPKGMLEGVAVSAPLVPVPLSGMFNVVFVADEVISMFPGSAPVVVGANVAVNDAVAPAAICWVAVNPLVL
jgi:hypothetical protein